MRYIVGLLTLICLGAVGCQSNSPEQPVAQGVEQGHAHSHGHTHGHSHEEAGPHGGHLVELGEEEYHAEWLHDDESGLITVYVLDGDAAADVPILADQITIDVKIGGNSSQHLLAAVDPAEETGTARFELSDKSLIEALKIAGQGAEAEITVEIQGTPYTGHFEHDAH